MRSLWVRREAHNPVEKVREGEVSCPYGKLTLNPSVGEDRPSSRPNSRVETIRRTSYELNPLRPIHTDKGPPHLSR